MKNRKSISKLFKLQIIVSGIALILLLLSLVFLCIALFAFDDLIVSSICLGVAAAFLVANIIDIVVLYQRFFKKTYLELYAKTKDNLEVLKSRKGDFKLYDNESNEFSLLNDKLDVIQNNINNSVTYYKNLSFEDLHLEKSSMYEGEEVISKESFVKNIPNLIDLSKCYRNTFVYLCYEAKEMKNEILVANNLKLMKAIKEAFKGDKILFAEDSLTSFFVYIPSIDSLSNVENTFKNISKNNPYISYNVSGQQVSPIRFSIVLYPFSNVEDILNDLHYADHKGELVNVYLPVRNFKKNFALSTDSERINSSNKMISDFVAIDKKGLKGSAYIREIYSYLNFVRDYFGFDLAGIVSVSEAADFVVKTECHDNACSLFIKEGTIFDSDLIGKIDTNKDDDFLYVFYNRASLLPEISGYLDKYSIESGCFFSLYINGKCIGLIYFLNTQKSFVYDTYLREVLVFYCNLIRGNFLIYTLNVENDDYKKTINNLLNVSKYMLYSINKESFILDFVSDTLKDLNKNVENGKYCYEAIYGLKKQCDDCPLLINRNKVAKIGGFSFTSSINLTFNHHRRPIILLEPITGEDKVLNSRFDPNLLIYNYYSFNSFLKEKFVENSKGYVVLTRIDNITVVLDEAGEYGYNYLIKTITRRLTEEGYFNRMYLYNNETLAFVFNEFDRNVVIDFVEKFNSIILEEHVFNEKKIKFSPTHFLLGYPLNYASFADFSRHIEQVMNSIKINGNNNLIIEGKELIRPASRTQYILNLINDAFKKNSFDFEILPFVNKKDKQIIGGEILLRLKDEIRNSNFNAYEFIRIISEHNMMNALSNLLIGQVGKIYKEYGATIFRTNGLERMSINIDTTYFMKPSFIDDMASIIYEYNFQKSFLKFEITEEDINNNIVRIPEIIKKLKSLDVDVVCDQYSGQHLSMEKLKEIGVKEIKIPYSIVKDITKDDSKFNIVREISVESRKQDLKVTLVGVENEAQYELIKTLDVNYCQGYYFSKPVSLLDFMSLIKRNK